MHIIENNLEVVEYENLLLPISIKIRELIQYKNKRAFNKITNWRSKRSNFSNKPKSRRGSDSYVFV